MTIALAIVCAITLILLAFFVAALVALSHLDRQARFFQEQNSWLWQTLLEREREEV